MSKPPQDDVLSVTPKQGDTLTPKQQEMLRKHLEGRRLDLYRPYKKQQMFHKASAEYREILLRAGNQLGKCVSYQTLIDLPGGAQAMAGHLFDVASPFKVMSWNGTKIIETWVSHAIRKPAEECYRVWFSNGRWVETAGRHRILTVCDSYMTVQHLLRCVPCLPPSNSELGLLTHVSDVRHYLKTSPDLQGDYRHESRLYDEQPQWEEDNDLFYSPLVSGVPLHNCVLCDLDDQHCKHTHIRQLESYPPSNQGAAHQNADHYAEFLRHDAYNSVQYKTQNNQESSQFSTEEVSQPRPNALICLNPLLSPYNDGNHIIAYQSVGVKPIYDFTVPKYSNYITAGVVHHNTLAAAAQTAIFATGKTPSWWEGRIFKKAPVIWCAGVTGEVVRDSIQRLLIGDIAHPGTGFIPASDIVDITPSRGVADLADTILVKHVSGGTTRIRLKYYEQGREKFQADTVDVVWLDEECDMGIYSEALTRTNATNGMLYMTFTPLKGMSDVVRRYLNENSPDRCDINMTIEDAEHISPEQRKKIIASYPAHEREARLNGTPMLGSGRIFPIPEDAIACDAIPADRVPMHWQHLGGMDFGWDHPTAAVKILYDPENDVIYLTHTYKRKEATPTVHASALRAWGDIMFAWPHDGLQHDKGSGVQLAQIYRNEGLKLLSEHARFADGTNGVEAGIAEMLVRMETGRLKVYRHLNDFFEEFRMYHRREGKVFKEYDDILSAFRYGIMMLRFAQFIFKPTVEGRGSHQSVYNPFDRARVQDEIKSGGGQPLHTSNYDPFNRDYVKKNW